MQQTIHILEDNLINKIAAGEVIESPSSVIKELVENSIDAKSENIFIEIKTSPLHFIKVEDDGIGMNKTDALLCFKRHATSKIKRFEDLIDVDTKGFRGEALASIAAVSYVDLKTSKDNVATHIKMTNSKLVSIDEIARTKGTTIEVKSLFHNVPVRKKFQKSLSYMNSEIIKVVQLLSLSHPEISFRLVINGKEIFSLEKANLEKKLAFKKRVQDLYKEDFIDSCMEVDFDFNEVKIFGFLSHAHICKKNRSKQYLIINDRVVQNFFISKIIKDTYLTRISKDDYPMFALSISIPKKIVDVNVHPQKKEIRISDFIFINEALKKAVEKTFEREFNIDDKKSFFSSNISFPNYEVKMQDDFQDSTIPSISENISFSEEKKEEKDSSQNDLNHSNYYDFPIEKENIFEKFEKQMIFDSSFDLDNYNNFFLIDNLVFMPSKNLTDFVDFEEDDKIVILDLSIIYQIFFYEKAKKSIANSTIQNLLIPININLSLDEISYVQDNIDQFLKIGFDIRIVSKNTISIDGIDQFLNQDNIQDLFLEILQDLKSFNKIEILNDKLLEKISYNILKFTRKRKYTNIDAIELINKFINSKNNKGHFLKSAPFIKLNKNKIDNLFKK